MAYGYTDRLVKGNLDTLLQQKKQALQPLWSTLTVHLKVESLAVSASQADISPHMPTQHAAQTLAV